jgi:hypothetical protein
VYLRLCYSKHGDTWYLPSAHRLPRAVVTGLEGVVGARGKDASVVQKGLCLTQVQQGHQPKPV